MNSVKASFAGGVLHSTDYFSSRDHEEGRAWLVLSSCDWHVLPRLQRCPPAALRAAMWEGSNCGQVPRRQIPSPHGYAKRPARIATRRVAGGCWRVSQRPLLPQPYTCSERTLTLYTSEMKATSSQSFFGSIRPGLQIHGTCPHGYAKRCWRACRLWLVRDTRRGEKAHDQQSRLERYRQQRPGGL